MRKVYKIERKRQKTGEKQREKEEKRKKGKIKGKEKTKETSKAYLLKKNTITTFTGSLVNFLLNGCLI